jgi:hypothetical protein
VQYFSGGVPRVVNSICDMAMVYGLADNKTDVDLDVVLRVIGDRQASGVSPFVRDGRADDPAVIAEITGLVREALELRAVSMEEEEAGDPPLAQEPAEQRNGHAAADNYPRLDTPADSGQGYEDLRIDALSLNDYLNGPKRGGANESQRPSWFRRTFKRTN